VGKGGVDFRGKKSRGGPNGVGEGNVFFCFWGVTQPRVKGDRMYPV